MAAASADTVMPAVLAPVALKVYGDATATSNVVPLPINLRQSPTDIVVAPTLAIAVVTTLYTNEIAVVPVPPGTSAPRAHSYDAGTETTVAAPPGIGRNQLDKVVHHCK